MQVRMHDIGKNSMVAWSLQPGSLRAQEVAPHFPMSPLTRALQGRSRLHRSYQTSRFPRRASTSAGSLKRCRAGGRAGAAVAAPARRAVRAQCTADGKELRGSTAAEAEARPSRCRLDAHRAPRFTRAQQAPETARAGCPCPAENTLHSPSPPATEHLRGATRASCSAPGAGPRSRRSAGAPRPPPPPPPGPAGGSWRSHCRRRARFPGKTFPAPAPREGQSEREAPPASQWKGGARGGLMPVFPRTQGWGGASRCAGANQQAGSKRSPPLLPPFRAAAREGPKRASLVKRLLNEIQISVENGFLER